jgi:hypothetical protein
VATGNVNRFFEIRVDAQIVPGLAKTAEHVACTLGKAMEKPLRLLNPRSAGRVIDDTHHEDPKDVLRSPNTRLVELDDRVADDSEAARDSLHGA